MINRFKQFEKYKLDRCQYLVELTPREQIEILKETGNRAKYKLKTGYFNNFDTIYIKEEQDTYHRHEIFQSPDAKIKLNEHGTFKFLVNSDFVNISANSSTGIELCKYSIEFGLVMLSVNNNYGNKKLHYVWAQNEDLIEVSISNNTEGFFDISATIDEIDANLLDFTDNILDIQIISKRITASNSSIQYSQYPKLARVINNVISKEHEYPFPKSIQI